MKNAEELRQRWQKKMLMELVEWKRQVEEAMTEVVAQYKAERRKIDAKRGNDTRPIPMPRVKLSETTAGAANAAWNRYRLMPASAALKTGRAFKTEYQKRHKSGPPYPPRRMRKWCGEDDVDLVLGTEYRLRDLEAQSRTCAAAIKMLQQNGRQTDQLLRALAEEPAAATES